jgi:tRNA(Ile)-lysidine synthase
MAPLAPFEPAPRLAAAVSGGADSLALALLADGWARARGGELLGLVVDHGLRPESAAEAMATVARLATVGIPARTLTLTDLAPGPALAERARAARFAALQTACAGAGILHLLLGHHAADQAETVLIRSLSGSGAAGLAGMAALVELPTVRLLRPLLDLPPDRLRPTLRHAGLEWVEDPSNRGTAALRPRLRALRGDAAGTGPATRGLVAAARVAGLARGRAELDIAMLLADRVAVYPEGFAVLAGEGGLSAPALGALLQAIAGAAFPPASAQVATLAAAPGPATLAGVRLMAAGRFGRGLLVVREAAAMADPVPARPGATWDGRFRLAGDATPPEEATIGALAADAAALRRHSDLPAAVLWTLPAIRRREMLVAVPHLLYPDAQFCARVRLAFAPPRPMCAGPFVPAAVPMPDWMQVQPGANRERAGDA